VKRSSWLRAPLAGRGHRARRAAARGEAQRSSIAAVASSLVSCSSDRRRRGCVLGTGLQAQQDTGERLVALVVQITREPRAFGLLALKDGAAVWARSSSRRASMRLKRDRGAPRRPSRRRRHRRAQTRAGEVDSLHDLDEPLERCEATAQHEAVDEHGAEDAGGEHGGLALSDDVVDRDAGGGDAGERRRRDEQRVDGEDLGGERRLAHLGSRPHIGRQTPVRYL